MARRWKLYRPEQFAGACVEGTESRVIRRADEHESTRCSDRSAKVGSAGITLAFGQAVGLAEIDTPRDVSVINVDRVEASPRRLLAHHVADGLFKAAEQPGH